jgi:tight adherence protein B
MVDFLIVLIVAICLAVGVTVVTNIYVSYLITRGSPRIKAVSLAMEMASIIRPPEFVLTVIVGIGAVVWFFFCIGFNVGLIAEIILLPIFIGLALFVFRMYILRKINKRRAKFMDQLEIALRLMSSGIRIGLSLPQAMTTITEEMSDPARAEFLRVIAQTRIGTSTADALDDLASRMVGSETLMLARVIRVQTQTGGSLSKILEHLAQTIKERRYISRKIGALTAEGRMGALVLEGLPIAVGLFIVTAERQLGAALLSNWIGHLVLIWVAFLEGMAIFVLNRMLKVNA